MNKYPGLTNEFADLYKRFQQEIQFPAPRTASRLLTLLPDNTVFYAAFPNYGNAARQALAIFRQQRQSRPVLRDWWQSPDMAKSAPQIESFIEQFSQLAQYVGDEIVISGAMNGAKGPPSIVLLAEVRRPGLKQALQTALRQLPQTPAPALRILDPQDLAAATDTTARAAVVLIRRDYVLVASDLKTAREFSARLDNPTRDFGAGAFAQRLQQEYGAGVSVLAGLDLQTILGKSQIAPQQQQVLQKTGFADMKYLIWEHKGGAGQAASEAELSFTRPRRGIASWMAASRELRGLDFVSPNALLAGSIALKNLGEVFDDVRNLATAANPNGFASLDQMQQGLGINLRDDLFRHLTGEIAFEIDDVTQSNAAWTLFLQVDDAQRLQRTLSTLFGTMPVSHQQFEQDGTTYHKLIILTAKNSVEITYAFVDGYLVAGSGVDNVREAVRVHRAGESLAKSSKFAAALPPGHSAQASGIFYEDPIKLMQLQMARLSPGVSSLFGSTLPITNPVVIGAYADESAIREANSTPGVDAGMFLIMGAVAIPNLVRARISANEASALGSLRTIVTAQLTYSTEYPQRGFARDLASLGPAREKPGGASPEHAGLIDAQLGSPDCLAGKWCEKSGYRFTLASTCKQLPCRQFIAIATPASPNTGSRSFCAASDGRVRVSLGAPLTAPLTAAECRSWQPLQ